MLIALFAVLATAQPTQQAVNAINQTQHLSPEAWTFLGLAVTGVLTFLGTRFTEKRKQEALIQVEKDKQRATLDSEKERHEASLKAEVAKQDAAIKAAREHHEAEMEIEKARSENSRAAAMETEIRRLREQSWKNQAQLQTQISEQRAELRAEQDYTDQLREHIYLGKPPPPPERPCREGKITPPIDLEAMNPLNFGMVPNPEHDDGEDTEPTTGAVLIP
jgi:DNA repair exonuclease SbcCD ATPase subunit